MLMVQELTDIATTIQSAIAPVFLLAAIGQIVTVISTRLSRAVDRTRVLEDVHSSSKDDVRKRYVWELRLLDRRISYANSAITCCIASALAVSLVIIILFVAQLASFPADKIVAALFVLAMLAFSVGIVLFLAEIRVAIGVLRVRAELLEDDPKI
jgi:hypothetical protein